MYISDLAVQTFRLAAFLRLTNLDHHNSKSLNFGAGCKHRGQPISLVFNPAEAIFGSFDHRPSFGLGSKCCRSQGCTREQPAKLLRLNLVGDSPARSGNSGCCSGRHNFFGSGEADPTGSPNIAQTVHFVVQRHDLAVSAESFALDFAA